MTEIGQKTKKIFCNQCKSLTNHVLRARHSLSEEMTYDLDGVEVADDDVVGIHVHRYSMWSCAGCTQPTLEWEVGYENPDLADNFDSFQGDYFPSRSKDSLPARVFTKLNPKLTRLYMEVIASFNWNCLLLCTIGLRALIEGICVDKGLTERELDRKIDGLIKFLPSLNLIDALHAFRFAGNDAAHRLEALTRDDAKRAIEVVEDLLNFLYDLDYKASLLRHASKRGAFNSITPDSVQ